MKTALRIGGLLLLVLVLGGLGIAGYISIFYPQVSPASTVEVKATPEFITRGRYLANHVAVCIDCHSTRDFSLFGGPIKPDSEGKGGEVFDRRFGFPGRFVAGNITPFNLKTWTDGEIIRAFTAGVGKDGRPFFPVMPYSAYRTMTQTDAQAVVAYLRTLEPIDFHPEPSEADFPFSIILKTIPSDAEPTGAEALKDPLNYGRYLATIAGCAECHTPAVKGEKVAGMDFAGGFEFSLPWGKLRSTNITPHGTGIGSWSKAAFVKRFKDYAQPEAQNKKVKKGEFNTIMPWGMYAGMQIKDLEAIYDYLRTVKPVANKVNKFEAKK